jgi:agmatinase
MGQTTNFGGLEEERCRAEDARIVVIPVPYDETSTWIKGAARGPAAVIEASANMELYDIETDSEVYKSGIFTDAAVEEKSSRHRGGEGPC